MRQLPIWAVAIVVGLVPAVGNEFQGRDASTDASPLSNDAGEHRPAQARTDLGIDGTRFTAQR